jgi:hypothetical protein
MIRFMSLRDDAEILSAARMSIARVLEQLDRDRTALAGQPQYAAGHDLLSRALGAAERLSDSLEPRPNSEHP